MIICIEGPDGAGKTTQANLLKDYIKENYPNLRPTYIHFPTKERNDISSILDKDSKIINPFFIASAYLNDFFYKTKVERLIPYEEKDEKLSYKTIEELASSSKYVFIFDRYYYSSLIMCTCWPNKHRNDLYREKDENDVEVTDQETINNLEKQYDEYLQGVFGVTGLLLKKFELPAPDLNIVILPDHDIAYSRISKKDKDRLERPGMFGKIYNAYLKAVTTNLSLFKMNGELMPPVVIRDSNTINIDTFDNSLASIMKSHSVSVSGNSKNPDQIHRNIRAVVDDYIAIRRDKNNNFPNHMIENYPDIKIFLDAWKDDNSDDFTHKIIGRIQNDPNRKELLDNIEKAPDRVVEKIPPVKQEEKKEKKLKSFFNIQEQDKIIKEADSKNLTNAKILYGFNDRDFYIYTKCNMSIDAILEDSDQFIPPSDYLPRERIDVINTMVKMLEAVETNKQFNQSKINTLVKYLRSKIEAIGMNSINTEGVK